MSALPHSSSMSLSITNPLILYRALVATSRIKPDPAQHRLALELQQLYYRLKDYNPEIEYRWRLERAARLSRGISDGQARKAVFDDGQSRFSISSLFTKDNRAMSMMALTRTVPAHTSAMEIDSPKGMLLYGEVGRGKSMLLDLLYSSLPTRKKRRWHFNTFILDIFRRLERARIERSSSPSALAVEHEHVVLSLARETMDTSPIIFLDEFQMPDRVSGKLVHSFMTNFFSLGGVLVASSNRMPEELANASGVEFSRMGSLSRWGQGRQIWEALSAGQKSARSDFGNFVELLKKRCEIWEMEGQKDWRRDGDADLDDAGEVLDKKDAAAILEALDEATAHANTEMTMSDSMHDSADTPKYYHITDLPSNASPIPAPSLSLQKTLDRINPSNTWHPSTLVVYARALKLSTTNPEHGVALIPFPQLCMANLGPADYISICSTFHTLVVTEVPILTLLQKNEARRFITFLDACYEARCRLTIEAAAPPDRLFFPETRARSGSGNMLEDSRGDLTESEAFSEMYQDSTAPFRPNVSVYNEASEQGSASGSTMSLFDRSTRSVLADEDADFGPTYGNGRSHGMSGAEDTIALDERHASTIGTSPQGMQEHILRQGPDFTQGAGAFTGQDEQFAYKRARSRLWELCGSRWWKARNMSPSEWWTPIHSEGRFWEQQQQQTREAQFAAAAAEIMREQTTNPAAGTAATTTISEGTDSADGTHNGRARRIDANLSDKVSSARDAALFRHGASPFRTSADPPPKFGWEHAWGMVKWGKKAGEWGKGVEGKRPREEEETVQNERK